MCHGFAKPMIASIAIALCGCTAMERSAPPPPAIAPLVGVGHDAAIDNPDYQIGRYYAARLDYDHAIAAYRRAVAADPGNAEIYNALGVAYASQGRFADAAEELKRALALAPRAAHIRNNLGYACLLQGRLDEAREWLKSAQAIEPAAARIAANLREAESRSGANGTPDTPAAALNRSATPSASAAPDLASAGGLRLRHVAPQVYELVAAPLAGSPDDKVMARQAPSVEVSNGNGIGGLARRTAHYLADLGYRTARLTNQKPFDQLRTEIQYAPGHEDAARRLSAALRLPPRIVPAAVALDSRVALRVVLGRDFGPRLIVTDAASRPAQRG